MATEQPVSHPSEPPASIVSQVPTAPAVTLNEVLAPNPQPATAPVEAPAAVVSPAPTVVPSEATAPKSQPPTSPSPQPATAPAPAAVVSPAPTVAPQPPASPSPQPVFLYVEDDAFSREIMKLMVVTVMKYPNMTILSDNQDFMDKVRALPAVPTVIFLDIQMKPHSGYDMLKMLRSDKQYDKSQVIAMTANVMASDLEELKAAGFNGLIGKPIMRQVFPDLLKQILDGQSVWFIA